MQVFPSKVSVVIVGIVLIAFLLPIVSMVGVIDFTAPSSVFFLLFILAALAATLYILFGTKYTIKDNVLYVRSGFIKFPAIPVKSIKKIEKTNSILSSPAASMDRIEIHYSTTSIIISPKDKQGFIEALQTIHPAIISTVPKN